MFAIAFDLTVAVADAAHPKGFRQAYSDIESVLGRHGFNRVQHSLYVTDDTDFINLVTALTALKALPWFPASVKDIRAFKLEHWSDFAAWMRP